MRRREFIAGLGGAVAWPVAARAQQQALPVIGFVNGNSAKASADRVRAFRDGLSETGYVDPRNVMLEYHWLEGQYDRLPALMADLVRRRPLVVNHQGLAIATTISFNLAPNASLGDAVREVGAAMRRLGVPSSIRGTFQGTARAFEQSLANEPYLIVTAIIAVYIVLGILYGSYIHRSQSCRPCRPPASGRCSP